MRPNKHYYINLYLENRAYGGPEEGGWWYNVGELVRTLGPFYCLKNKERFYERLHKIAQKMNKEEDRRHPSSVLCDGYYTVSVEDKPGQDFPVNRPYYE